MKIEVDGHTIQIKPINYVDRLGIKGEFADVYKDGTDNVTTKAFYLLLGSVSEIAFDDSEKSLKEYANFPIQWESFTENYLENCTTIVKKFLKDVQHN